jgi:hypothetical protein
LAASQNRFYRLATVDRAFSLSALSNEVRVTLSCCIANSADSRTGNVDCDPAKGVDISNLSALIDHLYINFTPLCCSEAANIDGDPAGGIDISDLSALIDYLYISFAPSAVCK